MYARLLLCCAISYADARYHIKMLRGLTHCSASHGRHLHARSSDSIYMTKKRLGPNFRGLLQIENAPGLTTLTNASVHAMHLGLQPFNHALACLDRGDCTILSDTCQGM